MTTWTEVSRDTEAAIANDHALVLEAAGIPSGTAYASGAHVLLVRVEDADRARAELSKYARENTTGPPAGSIPHPIGWSFAAAAVYAAVLVALDLAQRRDAFGIDWRSAGAASAGLIREGAWWRSLTALFLHADLLHLASNLVFGAAFGVMLAHSVGFGLAWVAFLFTGALGNELNAWLQVPAHTAIGASTAVFGMLGVQAAHDWAARRRLHVNLFRRWAPLAIGAAILAWLGGGSPDSRRIDVWAHVLGFAAGLFVGGAFGAIGVRRLAGTRTQVGLALCAAAATIAAWAFALAARG